MSSENKKSQVLLRLLAWCQARKTQVFHNDQVKEFAREIGFGNPFDVTKLDNLTLLPRHYRHSIWLSFTSGAEITPLFKESRRCTIDLSQ